MRFVTASAVALVLASLGVVSARADIVSVEASANALVMQGSPSTNYPSTNPWGDIMWTRWDGSATTFWVKFDLSKIQGTATSATLNLTQVWDDQGSGAPNPVMVGGLNDNDPGEGWGETTLTWNNAPGHYDYVSDPVKWPTNVTSLGAIDYPGAVGNVLTLTNSALLAAVNGDTNNSLTLAFTARGYNAGAIGFASRTDSFYAGPTLVLEGVTAVPEPSTMFMVCTGLAGLLAYAWRKRK